MKHQLPEKPFAVLFANGASCQPDLAIAALKAADYTLVLDHAHLRFLENGWKMDAILGDFDHQFPDVTGVEILHVPDQEATDFEKGMHHLISKGYETIVVLWATGRRADHFFTNCANLIRFPKHINISLWDDHSLIYRIHSGFEKYLEKDAIISLIPIGNVHGISTQNLAYPLNNESLSLGLRNGNSNHVKETGTVKITWEKGELLMMECWD